MLHIEEVDWNDELEKYISEKALLVDVKKQQWNKEFLKGWSAMDVGLGSLAATPTLEKLFPYIMQHKRTGGQCVLGFHGCVPQANFKDFKP